MSLSILVTNQQPATDDDVPPAMKELFRSYTRASDGEHYRLFCHQAEVMRHVGKDMNVFLVAGTASGKTLAIAVPLFHKLRTGRIRRILLMYPTVALMDDQRRVMEGLAEIAGLQVGQIQGGMRRSELVAALNKPVILATPDAIYWFFRKNIKYSGLLIYGLALVDEFVLDESHVFSGLMLRNLAHLKRRVQLLAERLNRYPRWHVLTATPTRELRSLADGIEVQGCSKCGDVRVTFLEPVTAHAERQARLIDAVDEAVAQGARKVLLVLNSADLAHRIFATERGRCQPELPIQVKYHFGRVSWGALRTWLERCGALADARAELELWLRCHEQFVLGDVPDNHRVAVPAEDLTAPIARVLEEQRWSLARLIHAAMRDANHDAVQTIARGLLGKGVLTRLVWEAVRPVLRLDSADATAAALDAWLTKIQDGVEHALAGTADHLTVTSPSFPEITEMLHSAGMSPALAEAVTKRLSSCIALPQETVASLAQPPKDLARRLISLSWLEWWSKGKAWREQLVGPLQEALEEGDLDVETRHIATWRMTDLPVILYTGKMAKSERSGLIQAFATLPEAILISTSAVELGVDFAADTLVTEQCDGAGFLQRLGRVGRRTGMQGRVTVLVRDGDTYVRLSQHYLPVMDRKAFSAFIADPQDGVFPSRVHVRESALLDATHYLVNTQLGEIGESLNESMFGDGHATRLAQQIRASQLPFAYGLRSTLPEITLRGGASGDPFYILRKVPNERLYQSDKPFEIAQADMSYTEFLWRKAYWREIAVEVSRTLESSRTIIWLQDGVWRLRMGYGIAADYLRLFSPAPVSKGRCLAALLTALKPQIVADLPGLLSDVRRHARKPVPQLLLRIGEALPLFFEPHNRFILGQGDIHLARVDEEGISHPVEDRLGNSLVVPDMTWLLFFGFRGEQVEMMLRAVSGLQLEEVVYSWQAHAVPDRFGPILLDRVVGACFDVYRRLVDYVGR